MRTFNDAIEELLISHMHAAINGDLMHTASIYYDQYEVVRSEIKINTNLISTIHVNKADKVMYRAAFNNQCIIKSYELLNNGRPDIELEGVYNLIFNLGKGNQFVITRTAHLNLNAPNFNVIHNGYHDLSLTDADLEDTGFELIPVPPITKWRLPVADFKHLTSRD